MAEPSTFRGTLDFLTEAGIFDVILPFLLVFTLIFALLEKTRILGTEKVGNNEYSKKSLNSLASFVIAFFVIASSQLVEIITEVSANVVLLVLAGVFFLLLAGSFQEQKPGGYFLNGGFNKVFMVIMFVGLLGIFLNAIETDGRSWLMWIIGFLRDFSSNVAVSSILLVAIVVGVMFYIGAFGKDTGGTQANNHK